MKKRKQQCSLAIAVAAALSTALPASALEQLGPGESAIIEAGDPADSWNLNQATLTMRPGSHAGNSANGIIAQGSEIFIDGGTVTSQRFGLDMLNSAAVITNGLIEADTGIILLSSSTADISDSVINAGGSGISIQGGAAATLSNSVVTASAVDGIGISIKGKGTVDVTRRSRVAGSENALHVFDGPASSGGDKQVTIDDSHLESGAGSAILVSEYPSAPGTVVAGIELRNGATVAAGNGVLLETVGAVTANLDIDNSVISGDVRNDAGATANVHLRNNASLAGTMTNVSSLALDNATWNITGDSGLGSLDLGNGTVTFAAPAGGSHKTLTVEGDFSGNGGMIVLNTVLADDASASDRLVIGGDTSGTANVRVNNVGGTGAQTVNGIELITVGGASNGRFDLAGRAVGGQYEYFLHKGSAGDGSWYLRSQLPTAPDPEPCAVDPSGPWCNPDNPGPLPGPDPSGDPYPLPGPDPSDDPHPLPGPDPERPNPEPVQRPESGTYLANLQAAQSMFPLGYHERSAGQNGGNSWVRADGSRLGFDAANSQLDIRGNTQSLAVGTDVWRTDGGNSVGVMLSSGNATSTTTSALTGYYARGKVKGAALGAYGTWRSANAADPYAGFYVDGSLQRAHFRNRVEGVGLEAERYTSRAWQGALEAGYAFRVGSVGHSGIYLEPQLQLGYDRWSDTRHTEVNGTVVTVGDASGLFGRAGVRLSGTIRWGNGAAEVQPYFAVNWLHNHAEPAVLMDDERVDVRIARSRAEFSGGASLKFASGVGVFGGLSLQSASGYHKTSAQLGVNYSW